jgi:hypothetical protein
MLGFFFIKLLLISRGNSNGALQMEGPVEIGPQGLMAVPNGDPQTERVIDSIHLILFSA